MFNDLLLFPQKLKIVDSGRDPLCFQAFPGGFLFMRGHSLVELPGPDYSAAGTIVHRIICRAKLIVHNVYQVYRYRCSHKSVHTKQ